MLGTSVPLPKALDILVYRCRRCDINTFVQVIREPSASKAPGDLRQAARVRASLTSYAYRRILRYGDGGGKMFATVVDWCLDG